MERPHLFTWGDNKIAKVFSRNLSSPPDYWASFIIYMIITSLKCIHWFKLVSQVSDVAHGPLVIHLSNKTLGLLFEFVMIKFFAVMSLHVVILLQRVSACAGSFYYISRIAFAKGYYTGGMTYNIKRNTKWNIVQVTNQSCQHVLNSLVPLSIMNSAMESPILIHFVQRNSLLNESSFPGFSKCHHFLAHLRWKLKWDFLIACCLSLVCL